MVARDGVAWSGGGVYTPLDVTEKWGGGLGEMPAVGNEAGGS